MVITQEQVLKMLDSEINNCNHKCDTCGLKKFNCEDIKIILDEIKNK